MTKLLILAGPRMSHMPYILSAIHDKFYSIDFIMGLYPTRGFRRLLRLLLNRQMFEKLNSRSQVPHNSYTVYVNPFAEICSHLVTTSKTFNSPRVVSNYLTRLCAYLFSLQSIIHLKRNRYSIFHYRCSFGLGSLVVAKNHNVIRLCDHSIAHPSLNHYMCLNGGAYPSNTSEVSASDSNDIIHQLMLDDIENSDHVIVNSKFVWESMVFMGVPSSKISIVVLPVDKAFLDQASNLMCIEKKLSSTHILFAGSFTERKGISTLFKAFNCLSNDFTLRIAGVSQDHIIRYCELNSLSHERIFGLGYMSRNDLLNEMLMTRIFVFPSLCEGYAKTIQEAMACGCYIIATSNSGFSVDNGEAGVIIPPSDPNSLATAINDALTIDDLDSLCLSNSAFAQEHFSSEAYGVKLRSVYHMLLA